MAAALQDITEKLCRISREHFIDPFSRLEWPDSLDRHQWFMSPELLSVYGTSRYEELDEDARKILSFYETVNFFSINIHGERMLIEGLAKRLYRRHTETVSPYLHHFLDEENKHMFYFGRFCHRYAGKVYPEKKLPMEHEAAEGEDEFLFFARVMLFEEMVDVYNRRMAKDERLVPIAREINWLHHFEEARHLVFGRRIVEALYETHGPDWSGEVIERLAAELVAFLESTWRDLFNPEAYRDAGLPDCYGLRRELLADPVVIERGRAFSKRCARTLTKIGLLTEDMIP